jgi:hypothetical protein
MKAGWLSNSRWSRDPHQASILSTVFFHTIFDWKKQSKADHDGLVHKAVTNMARAI